MNSFSNTFFSLKLNIQKRWNVKHFLFWLIFVCYEVFITSLVGNGSFKLTNYVMFYTLNIGLFYIHLKLLAFFNESKKYKFYVLIFFILFEIVIYILVKIFIDFVNTWNFTFVSNLRIYVIINVWRGLYFMGLATLYWIIKRYYSIQKKNHEIEKSKLLLAQEKTELELSLEQTKNAFLVQQMNPHLLFNGLNFIYNSNPYDSVASKSILLLSDMMRYSLNITDHEQLVLVNEEIKQVQNMVELNNLLMGEEMNLKVKLQEEETSSLKIIPLILLTLTENLFKHANLKSKEIDNFLTISFEGDKLHFHSLNLKKKLSTFKKSRPSLGIKNIIQRLNYAYKDAYQLAIKDDINTFEINLTLPT